MKNLFEKIYEDFFDNMIPFDNTPIPVEYYTLKKRGRNGEWLIYKTDRIGNRVNTTISKDAALFGIDKLSDLILKIDSNPGSKNGMYDLNEYLKDEGMAYLSIILPAQLKKLLQSFVKILLIKI